MKQPTMHNVKPRWQMALVVDFMLKIYESKIS